MQTRIVDTHIHIWDFSRAEYSWLKGNTSILNRSYHIEELEEERKKVGISDGVLVQAANNLEETRYMLEVAANTGWITGVVGWLPLMDPSTTIELINNQFSGNAHFKGIRHLIHDEADPKWLLQPQVIESLNILADHQLSFDIVGVLPEHIVTAQKVAEKIPSLRMVFDHLNQPPIKSKEKFGRWGELIREVAKQKNCFAKISGLGVTSCKPDWSSDDIKPYVEFIFEQFGIDRCFCGGDWPVSLLAGSYAATWSIYKGTIDSLLNDPDREKVYHNNAVSFYKL